MMQTAQNPRTVARRQPPVLPPHLLALIRPELPSLLAEIVAAICDGVPGYAEMVDGPYCHLLRQVVHGNVATFLSRVADPGAASPQRDELCRAAGRLEAENGHSMDRLQSAYRIGVQVALRRWTIVARRHNLATSEVTALTDALFSYIEEMTSLSRAGHAEARAGSADHLSRQRRRLLACLTGGDPISDVTATELAGRARWHLPEQATPVAVRSVQAAGAAAGDPGSAPLVNRDALDGDVLAALDDPQPHLLVPGPITPDREQMLVAALLDNATAAIGLTVPLSKVPNALRWARRTLSLAPSGRPGRMPARSEDHLLDLWLLGDPDLVCRIRLHQLAPLQPLSPSRRTRLTETLRAWLAARGNVEEISRTLGVHPQTVRHRMRALQEIFGSLLDDAQWRLVTELVLRE